MKIEEKPPLTPLQVADCKTGRMWGRIRRPKGVGSRVRIKRSSGDACYHVMSRTAGGVKRGQETLLIFQKRGQAKKGSGDYPRYL